MEYPSTYINKCKAAGFETPLTLEELWGMYQKLHPKKNNIELFSRIRIDMAQSGCDKFLFKQSIHEIFLVSYMYGKNKVCWDVRKQNWS